MKEIIDLSLDAPPEDARFCVFCQHYGKKTTCDECLNWPRERPFWKLKGQNTKQNEPNPAKPEPKFKRKLKGFNL